MLTTRLLSTWLQRCNNVFLFCHEMEERNWALLNVTQKCTHPAYQQIIGMGWEVLPLILRDLKESNADWFWALTAITGANPISTEIAGNITRMTEAWLQWARAKGYDV